MEKIIGIVMLILFFVLPILISRLFGIRRLPEEAERILERKTGIVCRYNTYIYAWLMEICLFVMVAFGAVTYNFFYEGEVVFSIILGMLVLAFFVMAVAFFLYQKNWVVVLYSDGIVFRNIFGKVYCCTNDKIVSCNRISAYRRRELHIVTDEKKIYLNYYCTNYYEAESFCCSKSYYK